LKYSKSRVEDVPSAFNLIGLSCLHRIQKRINWKLVAGTEHVDIKNDHDSEMLKKIIVAIEQQTTPDSRVQKLNYIRNMKNYRFTAILSQNENRKKNPGHSLKKGLTVCFEVIIASFYVLRTNPSH
jgi:CHASE3 domain sensor protein